VEAIGLDDVDIVFVDVPDLDVVEDEAVGAVRPNADVLGIAGRIRAGGRVIAERRIAAVDHNVVRAHACALDLEVAADARAVVGDAVAILRRRLRWRIRTGLAADHRDQVLVVRAGHLVAVGDRAGITPVVGLLEVGAGGIVGGRRSRGRLGVEAGHDLDPIVVAGCGDRRLDRAVGAGGEELLVEVTELLRLRLAHLDRGLGGPEPVAALLGARQTRLQPLQ
jgi:hypothetical protein